MSSFEDLHPSVLFIYYLIVIFISMFIVHPMVLIINMIGALSFYSFLVSKKRLLKDICYYICVFFLLAITNPLFSHNGETILFFMNDNPITLEAFVYGAAIACMIVGVVYWCKCYSFIFTTDKILYIFGEIIPKLSLVISMSIRFMPLLKRKVKEINKVQKSMGLFNSNGLVDKLMSGLRVFDCIVMWCIENSIDTADSMAARGYGKQRRSHFSLFSFSIRDAKVMTCIAVCILFIGIGYLMNMFTFYYYPKLTHIDLICFARWEYLFAIFFMFLPTFIMLKEKVKWKFLKSKM